MKCALCKANEGTIPMKQLADGAELVVCEDCARKHGYTINLPIPVLTDFLFGGGQGQKPAEDPACPACHMHRSDLNKGTLLGCPACYDSFASEVASMIENMQAGRLHVGKVPRRHMEAQISKWSEVLEKVVAAQEFEAAGRLRDAIAALRSKMAGGPAKTDTAESRGEAEAVTPP